MAEKTIRENFFDSKAIGSLWDVAVSLKRGNPLPIDADSVFESEAKLVEYIGDKITTVAYPGQIVAVVNTDSTQIFYIDQELNYHPVGTKLDADGKSIKVDNNVLKLVGFDEATDGLLAQVKVDAEGNRTLNWVSIETIAQGDGNTTYTFTGLDEESNVHFEVKASDAETATKIYLDTYTKKEIDDKFSAIDEIIGDKAEGETTSTGIYALIDKALQDAKDYADENDANTVYDDTEIIERIDNIENADYQNSTQVENAISIALSDFYSKENIDDKVDNLESKISAIPKFAIEVVEELPIENISSTTVYLVPDNDAKTSDVYDEYIYVNGAWELLGKQTLDLTGYATKTFVTDEITKLTQEGGAIKSVSDELDELTGLHNELSIDVEELYSVVGDETTGILKDVSDLKAIDHNKIVNDAIASHIADKDHFTEEEIASQISEALAEKDYDGKIDTAKQDAIDAAILAIPVKAVEEAEFTLTDGKLVLKSVEKSKVVGLVDDLDNIYTKTETNDKIVEIVGSKPNKSVDEETGKNIYSGATGIYVDIYTKDEVTDLISSFTGGESAADVLAELNKYKTSNDAKILAIDNIIGKDAEGETAATGIIGDIVTINTKLDAKLEGITVAGTPLAIVENTVDIPVATNTTLGVVLSSSSDNKISIASDGTMEVNSINVNKLVQNDDEELILFGGSAADLKQ